MKYTYKCVTNPAQDPPLSELIVNALGEHGYFLQYIYTSTEHAGPPITTYYFMKEEK